MLRHVALAIRQTLTGGHRWHVTNALDAHGTVICGLIQLVATTHHHVTEVTGVRI